MHLKDSCLEEDLRRIAANPEIDWSLFSGRTFFITGATGLIGSLAVKALIFAGETLHVPMRVLAMVRNPEKANAIYAEEYLNQETVSLQFVMGDVTEPVLVEEPVDYIIHAASPTGSKYFMTNPVEVIQSSVAGTDHVLRMAADKHAQGVVYISSMEVYGQPDPELEFITEEDLGYIDPLSVRSCYSEGKRICECLCASYAKEYQVPVCSARLAQTFGAGVLPAENRVFAQFARSAMREEDIVLHTDGSSEGNYCYTADTVTALLLLLQKGAAGEAYTVVNERSHTTIADMAEMVAEQIADRQIRVVFDIPENEAAYGFAPKVKLRLSGKKLQNLGWKPEVGLKEAYERMMESMRSQEQK